MVLRQRSTMPAGCSVRLLIWFVGTCFGAGTVMFLASCSQSPGKQIYLDQGCARCHGSGFQGTRLGPPLKGLRANWTGASLERYLDNPAEFLKQDRMKALHEKYQITMPRFTLDPEKRKLLVAYLLDEAG